MSRENEAVRCQGKWGTIAEDISGYIASLPDGTHTSIVEVMAHLYPKELEALLLTYTAHGGDAFGLTHAVERRLRQRNIQIGPPFYPWSRPLIVGPSFAFPMTIRHRSRWNPWWWVVKHFLS